MNGFHLNPLTRKRLRRFRAMRRAWWSFWILTALYTLSLGAELISNNRPLYLRFEGRHYFPVFRFYPEDTFTGSGRMTRPNYKQIVISPEFRANPDNRAVFAPIPHGPNETIEPDSLDIPDTVSVTLTPVPRVATLSIDAGGIVRRAVAADAFFDIGSAALVGQELGRLIAVPADIVIALEQRFANERELPLITRTVALEEDPDVTMVDLSLASHTPRDPAPAVMRVTLRETLPPDRTRSVLTFQPGVDEPMDSSPLWRRLHEEQRERIRADVRRRFEASVGSDLLTIDGIGHRVEYGKEEVRWPYPPVRGHWMGIDGAGRDVLARVIYGLRTSMTFGLLLVSVSVILGIVIGAVQGYFGGRFDLLAQRSIEIWSAIPFLYVMILLGSLFGRSFGLLLFCYGLFNWIGMSYYMRGEFLRLRRRPFVEAARGLGLSHHALIFRHILPNALVPVVTFTPFALVGAINALAALDFLGFGLPPPTASWGELIQQAQQYGWVWWLIFYPGLALFIVMLLGVFIGEGARNAFDPVPHQKLQ